MALKQRMLRRNISTFVYDAVASGIAFVLALSFSYGHGFNFSALPGPHVSIIYTVVFSAMAAAFLWASGIHRGMWRYTSLADFLVILRTVTLTVLCFLPFAFLSVRANLLPRSTPIIAWFLMVGLMAAPRIIVRSWKSSRVPGPFLARFRPSHSASAIPVLVVGTTASIEPFIRELGQHSDAPYVAVGVLTDEARVHGHVLHGVPVLGSMKNIEDALSYLLQRDIRPQRLVISSGGHSDDNAAALLDIATKYGLTLGRIPALTDLGASYNPKNLIRPLALGDLLQRPQIILNRTAIKDLVAGKSVLITGAGGSIGSELVRQVADLEPEKLVLLDNGEFNLYSIDKELSERHPNIQRYETLCDVRDRAAVFRCIKKHIPDIVFHAAALKHVPLVERNPLEGLRTNIIGTQNVVDACVKYGVKKMLLISSDKAVNPHNVMGATKRAAEAYCQAMDEMGPTRFFAIRFGNVLGSAGSVVPLFQRQLADGGPLTVTHPEMTRFFMTIPEAVSLVLQASALSSSDAARGCVFVLDMGEPIKIVDLARQVIRLSGKIPDVDVKIEFVGLRPGEKLYEELIHADEQAAKTPADGVIMVSPRTSSLATLQNTFAAISNACDSFDEEAALSLLGRVVPESNHPSLKALPFRPLGRKTADKMAIT